jgi:hypothetical protein
VVTDEIQRTLPSPSDLVKARVCLVGRWKNTADTEALVAWKRSKGPLVRKFLPVKLNLSGTAAE